VCNFDQRCIIISQNPKFHKHITEWVYHRNRIFSEGYQVKLMNELDQGGFLFSTSLVRHLRLCIQALRALTIIFLLMKRYLMMNKTVTVWARKISIRYLVCLFFHRENTTFFFFLYPSFFPSSVKVFCQVCNRNLNTEYAWPTMTPGKRTIVFYDSWLPIVIRGHSYLHTFW